MPIGSFASILVVFLIAGAGDPLDYVDASAGLASPGMEAGDTELEFGDVNGDGHPDIVCVGDHGSPFVNTDEHGVMVWFGDGAGNWSLFQNGNFGYGGLALGDVNGDGLMDVGYGVHHDWAGGDWGDQILEVALGDGTGMNWSPWDDGLATNGETWGMFDCDFADVDNDGDLDLGSISFGCCAGVHVYRNNGDGTWTQSWGFNAGNSAMDFVFGDIDADGNADMAVAHGSGTVYRGNGGGGFTRVDGNLGTRWRRGVALGDVTGDGRDSVAWAADAGVEVWRYVGDAQWESISGALASIGSFRRTAIADMNNDGHGDVVVFRPDLVRVYAGDGAGGWTLAASVALPDACDHAALTAGVDVDHNGFADIALVQEENCRPFVGGANRPRALLEASIPAVPFAVAAAPVPGEVWRAGSVRFIDWRAGVPAGQGAVTTTIAVSTSGPDGPWTDIAAGVPNSGRFQWRLPDDQRGGVDCRVRVTVGTDPPAVAVTPAGFTIIGVRRPGDVNGDGVVDFADVLALLASWGPCGPKCPADLDEDGDVDFADLLIVLANWST